MRKLQNKGQKEIPTINESATKIFGPKYITCQPEGSFWSHLIVAKLKHPAEPSEITKEIIRSISADQMAEYCFRTEDLSNKIGSQWDSKDNNFEFMKRENTFNGHSIPGILIENKCNKETMVFISNTSIANSYKFSNKTLEYKDIMDEWIELAKGGLFPNDDPSPHIQSNNVQNYAKKPIEEEKKQEKAPNQDDAAIRKFLEEGFFFDMKKEDIIKTLEQKNASENIFVSAEKCVPAITLKKLSSSLKMMLSELKDSLDIKKPQDDAAIRKFLEEGFFFDMKKEDIIKTLEQKNASENIFVSAEKCVPAITLKKLSSSLKMMLSELKDSLDIKKPQDDALIKFLIEKVTGLYTGKVDLWRIELVLRNDAVANDLLNKFNNLNINENNQHATSEDVKEALNLLSDEIHANENNHIFNQADNLH